MSHPSKWRRPCCDIYPEPDSLAASLRKVRFAIRPILTWNSATSRPFASMHRIARLWRRGFCALGTYLVRGWSLTHRKSTSRDGLFAHETLGGRLHLTERLSCITSTVTCTGFEFRTRWREIKTGKTDIGLGLRGPSYGTKRPGKCGLVKSIRFCRHRSFRWRWEIPRYFHGVL